MRRTRSTVCCALLLVAVIAVAGASRAAAAPNPFYGVVSGHYPTQEDFDRTARAGAGTFRLSILWKYIEPSPGVRNWYPMDKLVAMASRAGIHLLPTLFGVPSWISRDPSKPPIYNARQRAAWRRLLTDYASRYGTNGAFWRLYPEIPKLPIVTWEIWNEPNLGGFFGGKPNARQYARLLKISSSALRAGDPNAKVLTAGVFPYHTIKHTVDMVRYLNAFYRVRGVSNHFDALGIHPYARRPKLVLHWVRVARRIMRRHGDGRTPIWVTEFGWVTGGRRFGQSPLKSTFAQQAARLTRTYQLFEANASRLGIASAIWFSYTDIDAPGPDFWTDRAGLFQLNGQPKPSWYAFAHVAGGQP
jgi:hypothetical protein